MTENAYRGEVAVELGGESRILRYSWSAILELRAVVGGDVLSPMRQAMIDLNLEVVCKALVIGLRERWPEVTLEALMDLSPPLIPTMTAVEMALFRSFHGAKTLEEVTGEPSPNPLRWARRMIGKISSWWPSRMRSSPA